MAVLMHDIVIKEQHNLTCYKFGGRDILHNDRFITKIIHENLFQ